MTDNLKILQKSMNYKQPKSVSYPACPDELALEFNNQRKFLGRVACKKFRCDKEIAEDLVSKTIIRSIVKHHLYEGAINHDLCSKKSELRSWMITIMFRLYYNDIKNGKKMNFVPIENDDGFIPLPVSPTQLFELAEKNDKRVKEIVVNRCLKSLNEKDRHFLQYYLKKTKVAEIAEKENCTVRKARNSQSTALRNFKKTGISFVRAKSLRLNSLDL